MPGCQIVRCQIVQQSITSKGVQSYAPISVLHQNSQKWHRLRSWWTIIDRAFVHRWNFWAEVVDRCSHKSFFTGKTFVAKNRSKDCSQRQTTASTIFRKKIKSDLSKCKTKWTDDKQHRHRHKRSKGRVLKIDWMLLLNQQPLFELRS